MKRYFTLTLTSKQKEISLATVAETMADALKKLQGNVFFGTETSVKSKEVSKIDFETLTGLNKAQLI